MKLTLPAKRLLHEMVEDRRVILMSRHPRLWFGLRYTLNSFPMRSLQVQMVTTLLKRGLIRLTGRGYYEPSTKGMLVASKFKRDLERRHRPKVEVKP